MRAELAAARAVLFRSELGLHPDLHTVCVCVCMYACMRGVYVYACVCVCVCVCVYTCIYMYTYVYVNASSRIQDRFSCKILRKTLSKIT